MTKIKWDDEKFIDENPLLSWGKVGDFIFGTLTEKRQGKSKYENKAGSIMHIYDFLVDECSYHKMDKKGNAIEPAVELQKGDYITVFGRPSIDSSMKKSAIGQYVAIKFIDSKENEGAQDTKIVKVIFPKNAKGEPEMNTEWLANQEVHMPDDKDF